MGVGDGRTQSVGKVHGAFSAVSAAEQYCETCASSLCGAHSTALCSISYQTFAGFANPKVFGSGLEPLFCRAKNFFGVEFFEWEQMVCAHRSVERR